MLSFAMLFGLSAPALAAGHDLAAYSAQLEVIETYDRLYEKHNHDSQAALSELLTLHPSLSIVSSSTTYFDGNGNAIQQSRAATSPSYVSFADDELVFDSDWNTYIYFGEWSWNRDPELYETNLAPYDYVAFCTEDPVEMSARAFYVYYYDDEGTSVARYSSEAASNITGDIAKIKDNSYGAAFSVDDNVVRSGRMTVPLRYTANSTKRVMLNYIHSWTDRADTGIGVTLSLTGIGLTASWEDTVHQWKSISGGVSLS